MVFFLLWFVYPRGIGYGDVRLAGLLGMALGWLGVAPLLARDLHRVPARRRRRAAARCCGSFHRKHYPFGPFMVVGAWLGVVLPAPLVPRTPG